MDQSWPNRQQGGAPQSAVPMGAFRQGIIPTKERGAGSGDQYGKLRRHTRLSQSENQSSGAEEEWLSSSVEASGSYGQSPTLHGLQAEGIRYSRGGAASNGSGPMSSSPRSPNPRGYMSFQSRRSRAQQEDQGHPVTTVKASGTPHRQYSRGRNRTSSENENKGSRGPSQRKRGFSETESRPRWDKYGTSHTRDWERRDVCFQFI